MAPTFGSDDSPRDIEATAYYWGPDTNWTLQALGIHPIYADQLKSSQTHGQVLNGNFTLTNPGLYGFRVCADTQNVTPETNETNKCTDFQADVRLLAPDLIIPTNSLLQGGVVKKGKSASGSCTVGNIGNLAPTETIHVHHIYDGRVVDDDNFKPFHVAPGGIRTVNDIGGVKMGSVGTHSYYCCVDPHNANLDSNRTNNCGPVFYFQVVK
jgi:hypothetical protein